MRKTRDIVFLLAITGLMSGCSYIVGPEPGDPRYAPIPPATAHIPEYQGGAIYQTRYGSSLYNTIMPFQVGDILTVEFNESNKASKKADNKIEKKDELAMDGTALPSPAKSIPVLGRLVDENWTVSQERKFQGKGDAKQENSLTGSITVTVSRILANGNLMVRGEKWMKLNSGQEYIRLSGIVRPDDVDSTNTVQSTKIADARIAYSGTGSFADSSRQGWLSRFFGSVIWPF
ncbi:flagellar basal body L-ring protein FlgH [Piscirickettsia litoralis]|uniref:Flagellar L-ring protein n=1 Tax=Piscirickettsia litoralis TaxID=1891921 RepID=A0ABX3A0K3_9GAMM|nr:flagellar basal body L-ring protein FlgH [Piscirickettsia litoralis]ODN42000.1 flagellar basal body L-ring protein [Piscirickettsia litoralis]